MTATKMPHFFFSYFFQINIFPFQLLMLFSENVFSLSLSFWPPKHEAKLFKLPDKGLHPPSSSSFSLQTNPLKNYLFYVGRR